MTEKRGYRYFKMPAPTFTKLWLDDTISLAEIERRTGAKTPTLWRRAQALGLPKRKTGRKATINAADFKDMWEAGVSSSEICKRFKCSDPSVIQKAAARAGFSRRKSGWVPAITLAHFDVQQFAKRMAEAAAETRGAMRISEMVDHKSICLDLRAA